MTKPKALVANAADEQQVRRGKETEKHRLERECDDLRWSMSSIAGRRAKWLFLERAGLWRVSFSTDPYATAFNEGRRELGLWELARIMEWAPDLYELMAREARGEESAQPDPPLPEPE